MRMRFKPIDLNQSKDDSFVERVTKNNNWNNGDHHKIHETFLINCFVFATVPVWQTVQQFGNDSNYSKFNGEKIATNCSRVTVLASDGLTKKHFGHYALLKIFPSDHQIGIWEFQRYAPIKMWFIKQTPDYDVLKLTLILDQLQVASSDLKSHEQKSVTKKITTRWTNQKNLTNQIHFSPPKCWSTKQYSISKAG